MRAGLSGAAAFGLAGASLVTYTFLENIEVDPETLRLLIEISGATALLWVLVVFAFVKILFTSADGLVDLTEQLPVSRRERGAAIAVYETVIVVGVASVLFLPLFIAVFASIGATSVGPATIGVLMPIVTCYLIVAVAYNLVALALSSLRRPGLSHLSTMIVLVVLTLGYNAALPGIVTRLSEEFLAGSPRLVGPNLFSVVLAQHGSAAATCLFLGALLFGVPLVALSSPGRYPPPRRHLLVCLPSFDHDLWLVVAAIVRRIEWWTNVVICYLVSLVLSWSHDEVFAYGALLLLAQGIYVFSATEPMRALPGYRRSAVAELVLLLSGQGISIMAAWLPLLGLVLFRGEAAVAVSVGVMLVCGMTVTMLIGIVLVPQREDPMAAFVGYMVAIIVMVALAALLGLLGLPDVLLWGALGLVQVGIVGCSVNGVEKNQRGIRYAA